MKIAMEWTMSVRGRLTIAVTVLFGTALFLGGWFLLNRAETAWVDDLRAQDLAELEVLAQDITALDVSVGSGVSVFPLPVGVDGTTYQLTDDQGVVFGATPPEIFVSRGMIAASNGAYEQGFTVESIEDEPSGVAFGDLVTSLPVDVGDATFTLVAESSLARVEAGVDALRNTLVFVIPSLIALVAVLAWFVTGRAFRPVAAITNQVERITDDRLDERVPVPSSRDEVAHLARTMNTMLDRLSSGRRRQREFVSDASHELRNPVATSRAHLEVGLTNTDTTDWEETAKIVLTEQERLSELIDGLLLLARLDEGHPIVATDIDLDDVVYTEAKRPTRVPVDVSGVEAVRIQGDLSQLTRLVRNLMDNAVRYATDGVVVTLGRDGADVLMTVDDDGPGIPIEDRTRIFDRFVRTDDARARADGGSGLGLAIVSEVAAAHAGVVTITDSPMGGTRVEVRLNPATLGGSGVA